jgi:hypothetical protein
MAPALASTPTAQPMGTLVNLGIPISSLMGTGESFAFTTPSKTHFIRLGSDYFANKANQHLHLVSSLGKCVTDSLGCWSSERKAYVPLLVNVDKLKSYLASHSSSTALAVNNASYSHSNSTNSYQVNNAVWRGNGAFEVQDVGLISKLISIGGAVLTASAFMATMATGVGAAATIAGIVLSTADAFCNGHRC